MIDKPTTLRYRVMAVAVAVTASVALTAAAAAEEGATQEVDPLAELAALGDAMVDNNPEGGGSIRAKKDVDAELMARVQDKRNIEAKVEAVKTGKFPAVAVVLKVRSPAKEGAGKGVKKNEKLVVVPALKVKEGAVEMNDPDTLVNASAFYLRSGDRVVLRLGKQRGKVWQAEYIERK